MELLLIRHAPAEDPAPDRPDAARALTRRGRRRFRAAVAGLSRLGLDVDHVLYSPLDRAVQTAELLEPIEEGPAEQLEALALPPDRALVEAISAISARRIALVGHEPWLGELAALLITGKVGASGNLSFRKGGVAWLEGEPSLGGMTLRAWLPPRVLRAVAGAR